MIYFDKLNYIRTDLYWLFYPYCCIFMMFIEEIALNANYPNKLTLGNETSDREIRGARIMYVRQNIIGIKSRSKFCEDAPEIPPTSLKTWENGYFGGLTENGAEKISEHVKNLKVYCSPNWLLYGIGIPPQIITSDFLRPDENHFKQIVKEMLVFHEQKNATTATVIDEAMAPFAYPGYYVGGVIAENMDSLINQNCIVVDTDGQQHIRKLIESDKPGTYNLICLNSEAQTKHVKVKYAARIVLVRDPEL